MEQNREQKILMEIETGNSCMVIYSSGKAKAPKSI